MTNKTRAWTDIIKWGTDGLIPVVVQDYATGVLLMHAWMNKDALLLSLKEQRTVFWSRSRACLWRKGESSGHIQYIKELYLDCDADVLLVKAEQKGGIACHTGRKSCFYRQLVGSPDTVRIVDNQ